MFYLGKFACRDACRAACRGGQNTFCVGHFFIRLRWQLLHDVQMQAGRRGGGDEASSKRPGHPLDARWMGEGHSHSIARSRACLLPAHCDGRQAAGAAVRDVPVTGFEGCKKVHTEDCLFSSPWGSGCWLDRAGIPYHSSLRWAILSSVYLSRQEYGFLLSEPSDRKGNAELYPITSPPPPLLLLPCVHSGMCVTSRISQLTRKGKENLGLVCKVPQGARRLKPTLCLSFPGWGSWDTEPQPLSFHHPWLRPGPITTLPVPCPSSHSSLGSTWLPRLRAGVPAPGA
jgi:hypothetical protein